jgi:hypothetical protein
MTASCAMRTHAQDLRCPTAPVYQRQGLLQLLHLLLGRQGLGVVHGQSCPESGAPGSSSSSSSSSWGNGSSRRQRIRIAWYEVPCGSLVYM